jgi:predicted GH43/DUF377 family glycosyl hydrolase
MSPDGGDEEEGILNPAAARTREGELLLYPRCVAKGNISRIGIVRVEEEQDRYVAQRLGYALEPSEPYEVRPRPGYGCEDPRVTFIPVLDRYVMAYTAFGPDGPRIALAVSDDARSWMRLGPVRFDVPGIGGDDKDAAFFPEPVLSPKGVLSLAFYHRPMLHISAVDGRAAITIIDRLRMEDRESIRIAYVPLADVMRDIHALVTVRESALVLSPDYQWGSIKVGAGTPPVRIAEGWMSLYHGVDVLTLDGGPPRMRYAAGIVVHDLERPHEVRYRSPAPILEPETEAERTGTVDNVVFPTGIDPRPDLGERVYDIYYGMADYRIGIARLSLD